MKRFSLLVAAVIAAGTMSSFAQSKEAQNYKKQSEQIRTQVWSWQKPQFKARDIPAQYAGSSKVIIAQHTELSADSKSKIVFTGFGFGSSKEQTITKIEREIIKLNDKTAVTEYSELSYTQFSKNTNFFFSDKNTTFIGVRVIKPSGTVKEINADDIVLTKDEAREKRAKLAVPDLQPGDIIDFYIANEQVAKNGLIDQSYYMNLFDDAPILSYSYHAELGKKFAIEYRSFNGAPDLKVDKNDDKQIVIDVEKNNIPAFETSLWVAAARQLPYIRMNISMGYTGFGSKALGLSKPGEVAKITDGQRYMDDKAQALSGTYYNGYWMKVNQAEYHDLDDLAKKKAKQMGLNYKDMNDDDKAVLLYYTLRYTKLLNFDINEMAKKIDIGNLTYDGLAFQLYCTFKAAELHPAIMVSEDRTGPPADGVMSAVDLMSTAYLSDSKKFFSIQSVYDIPYTLPVYADGVKNTKSFTFDHPSMVMSLKKIYGLTNVDAGPNVAASKADQNSRVENLSISLNTEKSALAVKRSTTLKGYYKADEQKKLILYEDFYESERKAFNDEKSLVEQLEDNRKGKKCVDEVKNAFAEARKHQKDAFTSEAKNWFEQDITDMKDYKTDKLGTRHTDPDFVYSSSFNMGGLVKKAGNNYIVDIGIIQGQPLTIKDDQCKRDIDVYMPFARSITYKIVVDIPEGYTAEGVAALNAKEENETGFFIAEATSNDRQVTINVKKSYLNNFEPAANFGKLATFMDASGKWTNAKLLFKKK